MPFLNVRVPVKCIGPTAAGDVVDVDPGALADTLYTVYNGALVTWAIDGRGSLARWLTDRLDRVLAPYLAPSE